MLRSHKVALTQHEFLAANLDWGGGCTALGVFCTRRSLARLTARASLIRNRRPAKECLMKTLVFALLAAALFVAAALGTARTASAHDDTFVGVRIGPIGFGLDFNDNDDGYYRHRDRHRYRHRYYGDYGDRYRYRDRYDDDWRDHRRRYRRSHDYDNDYYRPYSYSYYDRPYYRTHYDYDRRYYRSDYDYRPYRHRHRHHRRHWDDCGWGGYGCW